MGLHSYVYIYIWVYYNISLTWIKAILGWFPFLTMIPSEVAVRSLYFTQIYIYMYIMAIQNWSLLMITSGGISGNSHFLGLPENEEPQFQWIIIIFPPKMTTFGDLLSITEASDGSLRSASFLSETQCGMSQAWASRLLGSLVFNPICWRIRYLHPFLLTIFFSKRHIFPASCDPEGMETTLHGCLKNGSPQVHWFIIMNHYPY